ncbi:methylated-DNA--[protein]-cysteine S-methyltransferase [Shinella sp. CPCC 100929]|uniref:Methylated-DNA--[protein]-cysteine S-methyltransferase n=1 Tax=Shinella lacus TaxID=2654216 RepID=A0ABT1R0A8_9HYPH|nr:methylated-DNA--[protein]-cysteine S-methyltransferase [Shinella lacus]MCQ4628600.1 methylated-DNA--[protein]-cysteine S-methyltransferase [Shinella lacus]
MREIIRFAWGISSLGDFVVAMSDKGLVALEFSSQRAAMEDALRSRFPDAELEHDQTALAGVLDAAAGLIDDPAIGSDLPLDLRGTPYEVRVWQMLRDISAGETTNYGALAARLGTRDAREVTVAIASNPLAIVVPCHRVIKKDGSISGYRWGVQRKRVLLAREQRAHGLGAEPRSEAR